MCAFRAIRNRIGGSCNACPIPRLTLCTVFPSAGTGDFIMQIKEVMSRNVVLASPRESLSEVAQMMAEKDVGFMPVGEGDRIVGMVTDRDMVIRGLAKGKGPETPVSDVMTRDVKYCFDDEDIDHVVANMGENQVRRLPVMNREKRLVGIVSLADAALEHDPVVVGEAFLRVVEPGGDHCQTAA
jgi:CBS domain-containing protein